MSAGAIARSQHLQHRIRQYHEAEAETCSPLLAAKLSNRSSMDRMNCTGSDAQFEPETSPGMLWEGNAGLPENDSRPACRGSPLADTPDEENPSILAAIAARTAFLGGLYRSAAARLGFHVACTHRFGLAFAL